MKKLISLALLCAPLMIGACSDDKPNPPPSGFPAAPTLGAQIDRMGRPGINTALTDPFWDNGTRTLASHKMIQDTYNQAADPSTWAAMFTTPIKNALPVYDSLDRNCGNQLAAAATLSADRYNQLAAVLADDQLYVNSNSGTCQTYLGVEANALGVTNSDCGGRTPTEDVIDETYSVLAIGQLTGVNDGLTTDQDGTPSNDVYPFLANPTP